MTQKTRPDIAEWLRSLGNVPLGRIVMDPLPGSATEQDLLRMVEREKRLVELIDGTLVEKPVGWMESRIAMAIALALGDFIRPRRLGYLAGADGTLRMKSGRIRLPDVSFVSADDVPGGVLPNEAVPELPPTLAVEVISESNTAEEMRLKVAEYFESGSRLVWLVYPQTRTIAVFDRPGTEPTRVLGMDDVLEGGTAVPGFAVPVSEVFAPLTRGF
jgi:Uma2 family endonuclease